jgi:hypothetical protein
VAVLVVLTPQVILMEMLAVLAAEDQCQMQIHLLRKQVVREQKIKVLLVV